MAVRADSGYSRVEDRNTPSSSRFSGVHVSEKSENALKKEATMLTPWPARKRASNKKFF
jgi:hypothetical protein